MKAALPEDKREQLSLLASLIDAMALFDAAQANGNEAEMAAAHEALRSAAEAMQSYAGDDETSEAYQTVGTILRALDAAAVLDSPSNDAKADEAITAFAHAFATLALANSYDASPGDKANAFFTAGQAGQAAAAAMKTVALAAAYAAFMAETDGIFISGTDYGAAMLGLLEGITETEDTWDKTDDAYKKAQAAYDARIEHYADAFATQYADAYSFAETFHLSASPETDPRVYEATKMYSYEKAYAEAYASFMETYSKENINFEDVFGSLYDGITDHSNLPSLLDTLQSTFIDQHELEGYSDFTICDNVTSIILTGGTTAILSNVDIDSLGKKTNPQLFSRAAVLRASY